jgi:serine/threonine kinase PknH
LVKGTPFGRYRLVELIGRGGMGEVWRAYDTATDRIVAVKVLPAHLADDQTFEERFRREANAAAALNEPHVVPIHNFGEIDGRLYVDMRLIDGRDLQTLLSEGPLLPTRAVMVIEQVAAALNAAHRVGLVHRDVKPSNILVAEFDFAYLIDFGIARVAGQTGLTNTGSMIGTWAYMAPERFSTGHADPRSDTYALACVLHECLTGRQPYPGDSVEQQISAHLMTPPPRPSTTQPGVPPGFDTVIATGMAKEPQHRYPSTIEMARAARAAITTPIPRPAPSYLPQQSTLLAPLNRPPVNRPPVTAPPTLWPSPSPAAAPAGPRSVPDMPAAQSVSTHVVPQNRSRWRPEIVLPAVGVVIVIAAAIFATLQLQNRQNRSTDTPATSPPTASTLPPLTEATLDEVLLSIVELNRIVGSTQMTITSDLQVMTDHSADVNDPDCLGSVYGAEKPVYAPFGWTAVRDQVAREPGDDNPHWVEQTAVLYPSAEQAQNFFHDSQSKWKNCAGQSISVKNAETTYQWQIDDVTAKDTLITQMSTQNDARGWACHHALSVVSNLTVEAFACGYSIRNEAATMANRMIANAT